MTPPPKEISWTHSYHLQAARTAAVQPFLWCSLWPGHIDPIDCKPPLLPSATSGLYLHLYGRCPPPSLAPRVTPAPSHPLYATVDNTRTVIAPSNLSWEIYLQAFFKGIVNGFRLNQDIKLRIFFPYGGVHFPPLVVNENREILACLIPLPRPCPHHMVKK